MRRTLSKLLALFALITRFGCGRDELSSAFDNAAMQSALESAGDSADDADAETGDNLDSFDPNALTVGCATIVTNPDPLTRPLPDNYSVNYTFVDCVYNGKTQNGVRTVEVNRDADGNRHYVGHRDIQRRTRLGATIDIVGDGAMVAVGSRDTGTIERSLTFQENRVRSKRNGEVDFDVDISANDFSTTDSYAPLTLRPQQRILNGSVRIHGNRVDADLTTNFNEVTIQRALCCYPISGSIHQQLERHGRILRERDFMFSSTCGEVTRSDGEVIQLDACQ